VTAGLLNPVRGFNRVVRGEAWKVSRTPMLVATFSITSSAGVRSGFSTTPSIRLAWS